MNFPGFLGQTKVNLVNQGKHTMQCIQFLLGKFLSKFKNKRQNRFKNVEMSNIKAN